MLKLSHFRHNLMVLLIMAALFPIAGRQLIMVLIPAKAADLSSEGSVRRSVRRLFNRAFLHQLNCQSLERLQKNTKPISKVVVFHEFPRTVPVFKAAVKSNHAIFGQNVFSSEGSIPLRI